MSNKFNIYGAILAIALMSFGIVIDNLSIAIYSGFVASCFLICYYQNL